ncbi:hypothetical protein D3870_19625 [Noviherbaspirillum cavernae]|uniref:Transferrin-binding protein B C-lobe/N-lobe beta barrel domain-containing protein n=2 Tax=Noviherbaspirillum cavernae TaxID=2320862 RepID=A0A418WVE2_9BURK|nr:hypothetical protein D3870_19625 [Noviherbaspirillum cavernae]
MAGCGGGGGDSSGNANPNTKGTTTPTDQSNSASDTAMMMSCNDGFQCSGGSVIRTDNGVTLTRSGVQVYGKSTSDLAAVIADPTTATGLALASGGLAEVRLARDASGVISKAELILRTLGLSWDGKVERPVIVETFDPTQGRTVLGTNDAITSLALPPSSDLDFFDFARKDVAATQANYANNRYFPRTGNPSRCAPAAAFCPDIETAGLAFHQGDWRSGGSDPDVARAGRLHGDGDVHAGNDVPDAGGNPTALPGGNGFSVPFPGSKGYRSFDGLSFQYGNLAAWTTQDTVLLNEWARLGKEHNKNRRGIVAFGKVAAPASIPASGTAVYTGIAYGWYARNASDDAIPFRGNASVTVNFAAREVIVTVDQTVSNDAAATALPVTLRATTAMGAAGASTANYLTGTVDNGTLKGGLSGRYFGPENTAAAIPAEIGGAFSLSNDTSGQTAIGGFIGRRQ